jgi:predicted RND superfamily exporter protein
MLLGVPFTSITQLLPFILLGIGVDDMFVLVRAMEEVDESFVGLPMEQRFRKCMESGGVSITVTTLTNAAAFALGSITSIPAIRWFCWCAAQLSNCCLLLSGATWVLLTPVFLIWPTPQL